MNPLDDREQRWARWGAGVGAVAFIAYWAPSFDRRPAVTLALIGCAMAAALAFAARRRRRLLTGLAAMVMGFGPWGGVWLLGLPYLVLAARLALRAQRLEEVGPDHG
ncbi:MAG: hypothetical protein ABIS21_08500 [Acidimicrobiales bacterium]